MQNPDSCPLINFRHHTPIQIRFNDIDMLGHVNNTLYFVYMDLAKTRYFQAVLGEKFEWGTIGLVIVNTNCDFCQPTFIDDNIEVVTAVTSIGEKSLTLEQQVVSRDDGSLRAHCRTIMVGFDPVKNSSMPITNLWRQALSRYEGREF
ncbi:MAG: acyl-CoA thioesterase [Bacteroides sp.]|nr:acyl-CoA thioesterase [Bacteroides sp.]MBD5271102.1 acyl-CoA thioesterase [Bacteroides sp.]MBD5332429.1 acyl-CoA thioesterase [Bacteroides sp.]